MSQALEQAVREAGGRVRAALAARFRDLDLAEEAFAETHEQLGGYYLLEVANLDEAIAWARKLPLATDGSVEIRPVIEMPE